MKKGIHININGIIVFFLMSHLDLNHFSLSCSQVYLKEVCNEYHLLMKLSHNSPVQ